MKFFTTFLALFAIAIATPALRAQQPTPPAPAAPEPGTKNAGRISVVLVTGEVYIFTAGETYRITLRTGSLITEGQMIATGPKASVMLAFSNGATVTIGEKSLVELDEFTQHPFSAMFKMSEATAEPSNSQTRLDLVRGELIANVKKLNKEEGSNFEIKTPLGVAGIRGTTFQISYIPEDQKDTPNAKRNVTAADFAIVMLEGVIEMNVPNKTKPITVPQGKQLVLENIEINAEGETTTSMDDESTGDTPAAAQALLMQRAQTMLSFVADISIPGSHAPGPGVTANTSTGAPGLGSGSDQKQDVQQQNTDTQSDNEGEAEALSPSPTPQNPAPRLSPTDGTGK